MIQKFSLFTFIFLLNVNNAEAWGFWAHKQINRLAVFALPAEMQYLFKPNIDYLTNHAVDPDKRRYAVADEAPRHYIDMEHYCDSFHKGCAPLLWKDAVVLYSEDSLKAYGMVPWHIQKMMFKLEEAFVSKNKKRILKIASDLGHYVGDANVPLHTTENYNGQLTNQHGIHGFWESRIPELFGEDYSFWVGGAEYIENPPQRIWDVVYQSHLSLDTVLNFEKVARSLIPEDQLFGYEQKGQMIIKVPSEIYSKKYSDLMDGMVERKMKESVKMVADIWYTCWVNAGMPDLKKMMEGEEDEQEAKLEEQAESNRQKNKEKLGRDHPETGKE